MLLVTLGNPAPGKFRNHTFMDIGTFHLSLFIGYVILITKLITTTYLLFWLAGFVDISVFIVDTIMKLRDTNTILEHCQGEYHIAFHVMLFVLFYHSPLISFTNHNLGHFTMHNT